MFRKGGFLRGVFVGTLVGALVFASAVWAAVAYFPNTTLAVDMATTFCDQGSPSVPWLMASDGTNFLCEAPPSSPAFALGSPTSRSLTAGTAYQCTTTAKPCLVTINLQSTASITLSGGSTNTMQCLEAATSGGITGGTGNVIGVHSNSNTGTLTIGLALNTIATTQCTVPVPSGGYFGLKSVAGTVTIVNAWDQSLG